LGIIDWINTSFNSLTGTEPDLGLNPKFETWPRLLQHAGYKTGLIGKWHLGMRDTNHPANFGFETFVGFRGGGIATVDPVLEFEGKPKQFSGLTEDVIATEAINFLHQHQHQRFLLAVHFRAPHTRWLPVADEDMEPYGTLVPGIPNRDYPELDVKRVERMMVEYLASVRSVDRNLGRILESLDRLNLAANTLVVFTSDHGYNMGHNGVWHKGNGHWILTRSVPGTDNVPDNQRPNMYDNSIKVPTIVRWPGKIRPGVVYDEFMSNVDWFPTLLSATGVPIPSGLTVRGRDFIPLLRGGAFTAPDHYYAQYSTRHQSVTDMRMISTGEWKLVLDFRNPERHELYDLVRDTAETQNLYASDNAVTRMIIEELRLRLARIMIETDDPILKMRM
jgi:uncharacterized sulfatase